MAVRYNFFLNLTFVLGVLDPLMLVFLAFNLAIHEHFPEDLIKTIFNIKFLGRLDSQLERMYLHFVKLSFVLFTQVSGLSILKHLSVDFFLCL